MFPGNVLIAGDNASSMYDSVLLWEMGILAALNTWVTDYPDPKDHWGCWQLRSKGIPGVLDARFQRAYPTIVPD